MHFRRLQGVNKPGLGVPQLRVITGAKAQRRHEPIGPIERDAQHDPEVIEPFRADIHGGRQARQTTNHGLGHLDGRRPGGR